MTPEEHYERAAELVERSDRAEREAAREGYGDVTADLIRACSTLALAHVALADSPSGPRSRRPVPPIWPNPGLIGQA